MYSLLRQVNRNDLVRVGASSDQLGYTVDLNSFRERFHGRNTLPNHALSVSENGVAKGWIHFELGFDLIEERKLAREWAKTFGVTTIYLSCNILRDRAHAFYVREGFTKIKTSHFFEAKI